MNKKLSSLLVVIFLASGCTTVREGLVGEEHEDVGPFAEATVELMTVAKIDFRDTELVYLRRYYDANEAALQGLTEVLNRIDEYRDNIASYSLALVRISVSNPTDAEKCNELADLVEGDSAERFFRDHGISSDAYVTIAGELRAEKDFLACLRMLQPVIVRSGEAFEAMLGEAESVLVPEMVRLIDASVEREFVTVLRQLDVVYERRDELFKGLQAIRAYRKGDAEALRVLESGTAVTDPAYRLPKSPSDAQLERTKDHIVAQLQKEETILALLARDEADYIATRAEFERERAEILDGLDLARRQVTAWVRAHQDLANGVRDPGAWLKGIMQVMATYKKVN